jgi:4'-phosphopantetheinyl transferase
MLSGRPDPYQINFNLSHSCDMALLAVARGRNVGIDIEFCQEIGLDEVLAPEVFSQREVQAFNQLPANKRVETFYAHWTQKEAWVKAIGYGLGYPFQIPEFAFSPGDSVRLAATFASGGEVRWWSVRSLDVARGYVGAVAVEGDDWNLYLFAYDPKGLPDPASASVRLKAPDCQVAGL